MRAILLTAAVVLAIALPAVAQAQGQQGNSGYQDEQDNDRSSAPMWRGSGPHHWHDDDGQWGDMGRMSGAQHMREMMMMRMAGGLGAGTFYRFKRGDDEVDIRCSPREQLQDCVNGAIQLMKALPPAGSATATGQTQH